MTRKLPQFSAVEKGWFVLSTLLSLGLFLSVYFLLFYRSNIDPPQAQKKEPGGFPVESRLAEPQFQIIEGKIKARSNFFKALSEKKIPIQQVELIVSRLEPLVNFRKIKGGSYCYVSDLDGNLVRFTFEESPTEVFEIKRDDSQGFVSEKKEVPLETYLVKVEGEIRSSLFDAMEAAGEQDQLVLAFAEVLAWEIDFYKDIKEGDRFKVLVEKLYKDKEFIRYGPIHAVEYRRGEKTIWGIAYQGDFFTEKGLTLKKAFLKAPLRFNRISSRFSRGRIHPILGGVRPHFGVDYAAPPGTPVWAVGDGTVVSCGWNSGFGKQVILRHRNGYMTCYGHLSRYGAGIKTGKIVKQKQVIGYVGSTGLSTGPHLDYRLVKNGIYKNPLMEIFPEGFPIAEGELEGFQKRRDEILSYLDSKAGPCLRPGNGLKCQ